MKGPESEQLVAQVRSEFGIEAIFVKTDGLQGPIDILVDKA
ncbi:hypothetical protein [Rhodococcus globerulus]